MARFDVHLLAGKNIKVLEVQADLFSSLGSTLVIPLLAANTPGETFMPKLHPELILDGERYHLLTTEMSAFPRKELGQCVGNLASQRDAIVDAIDFYMQGF